MKTSFHQISPTALCSLFPTRLMLYKTFNQDWPIGLRCIQVWKCGRRTTTDQCYNTILSMNEKLPLTGIHLTLEYIWIFLDRELPSVQLSFLWCTVLWNGTTENGVRHTWMHDTLSVMNTRCFHWVLWELAKFWWFLKVWASFTLYDGIIETISIAFSYNLFQSYTGIYVFENNVLHFDKQRKAQKARAAAAP